MASNAALFQASPSALSGAFTCRSCHAQLDARSQVPPLSMLGRFRSFSHNLASTSSLSSLEPSDRLSSFWGGKRQEKLRSQTRRGEIRAANNVGVATEARELERVAAKEALLLAV